MGNHFPQPHAYNSQTCRIYRLLLVLQAFAQGWQAGYLPRGKYLGIYPGKKGKKTLRFFPHKLGEKPQISLKPQFLYCFQHCYASFKLFISSLELKSTFFVVILFMMNYIPQFDPFKISLDQLTVAQVNVKEPRFIKLLKQISRNYIQFW